MSYGNLAGGVIEIAADGTGGMIAYMLVFADGDGDEGYAWEVGLEMLGAVMFGSGWKNLKYLTVSNPSSYIYYLGIHS